MAKQVIHISDVEAAKDFASLLTQVRTGTEIVIERDARPVAVVRPVADASVGRPFSEPVAPAEAHAHGQEYEPPTGTYFAGDLRQPVGSSPLPPPGMELEFSALVKKWRKETQHTSSMTKTIAHPAYRRIMGMGRDVLPLLFRELKERPDHWLVALNAITGEDPAPAESSFNEAVDAWLAWGAQKGYLR